MGAINYGTSDFITIGYNCDFIDYDDEFYYDIVCDYYEQAKYTLDKYTFNCFSVKLEPGYYEGFYIRIKFEFLYFDDYYEKQQAQKEITLIKEFLLQCVNDFECCAVWPGWCTTYFNYKDSLKHINIAIKEMRDEIQHTPTARDYFKREAI